MIRANGKKLNGALSRGWKAVLLIFALSFLGCASILNPYKDDFACPDFDRGRCVHVEEAHRQSLQSRGGRDSGMHCAACREEAGRKGFGEKQYCTGCMKGEKENGTARRRDIAAADSEAAGSMYQEEVKRKLTGLLRMPNAPILAPPKVVRILVLPYRGDGNELFMMRHIYFMADEPRWVLGENLMERRR